jgi:hypothetical protein
LQADVFWVGGSSVTVLIFFPILLMVSPVRPVQRHDERPEPRRTSGVRFSGNIHFRLLAEDSSAARGSPD